LPVALQECETRSLSLKDIQKLKVNYKRMLRISMTKEEVKLGNLKSRDAVKVQNVLLAVVLTM
jgi:hypothetical protein